MFNLKDHVDLSQAIAPTNSTTEEVAPTERASTTELLVKICFDQDEGLPPAAGRYATFYNLYLVSKAWVTEKDNCAYLAKRFPAFTIVSFPGLSQIVQSPLYNSDTKEWFRQNASDYYMLIPITTVKKGSFKFSGVHIPAYYTQRGSFKVQSHQLTIIATCYFGSWDRWPGSAMMEYSTNKRKRDYKNKIEVVGDWVHSEIERLGQALA